MVTRQGVHGDFFHGWAEHTLPVRTLSFPAEVNTPAVPNTGEAPDLVYIEILAPEIRICTAGLGNAIPTRQQLEAEDLREQLEEQLGGDIRFGLWGSGGAPRPRRGGHKSATGSSQQ